jgi:enolase
MKIKSIKANEILASGGYPTLEVTVDLESGHSARASVPYGASAGSHEATVLVDQDSTRYHGQGMLKAIENVKQRIWPVIEHLNPEDQRALDQAMIELDGTPNKAVLGGNAILAVSLAVSKAVAKAKNQDLFEHWREIFAINQPLKLPNPMVVAIEGGKHADQTTDLQEYCLTGMAAGGPSENIRKTLESYHSLKKVLQEQNLSTNVGNEGAFAPNGIPSNESPFEYMIKAVEQAGFTPGQDIGISIDAAANEFYKNGQYHLRLENRILSAPELSQYYQTWLQKYPILTLEDCFAEDDWQAWIDFLSVAKQHNVPHIGDDLTVTNQQRLEEAVQKQAISGMVIKLNQSGTVTQTIDTSLIAKQNNLLLVTSHRGGGESNDASMVDLAVAVGSDYIKVGPTRGERVSKYNRLMEIERKLS